MMEDLLFLSLSPVQCHVSLKLRIGSFFCRHGIFSIETRLNLVSFFINKLQRKSKPVRLVQTGIRRRGSGFDCDSSFVSASVAFCFLVLDVRQVSSKVILSSFINCTWQHCPLQVISIYNIDRTRRAPWSVKNPCFIWVKTIGNACHITSISQRKKCRE